MINVCVYVTLPGVDPHSFGDGAWGAAEAAVMRMQGTPLPADVPQAKDVLANRPDEIRVWWQLQESDHTRALYRVLPALGALVDDEELSRVEIFASTQ